ncbi:MAG: hypothetical protein ACJ72N_20895 [Labedaea sp.]
MRKLAVLSVVAGCLFVVIPAAGAATPVDDAAAALRTDSVYLAREANRNLDVAAVRRAIGTEPIKIAVIPKIESVAEVAALPRLLANQLPGNTIAVISGRYFYAGSEVVCTGSAGRAASNAINANEAALDANNTPDSPSDITKPLTDFITEIKSAPKCPNEVGRSDRYADPAGGGVALAGKDDTATVLPWVLGGIGTAVVVLGTLVLLIRRRTRKRAVHDRDEATVLVQQLAEELADLAAGVDGDVAESRAEAAARHGEAEAILISATTDAQFAAAKAAAHEGLTAARAVRAALDRR